MMLRVPECAGSEALTNSAEIGGTRGGNYVSSGNNLSEDCDPRSPVSVSSDYSQEVDSTLRSMGAHQVANWTSISSDYMVFSMDAPGQTETYEMRAKVDNAVIHSLPQEYTELYKDMDEERDGSEDTGGGQSKRASLVRHSTAGLTISTNPTLPTSFRPLIREGKVQFEIWVVAFLELNPLLQGNAGQAAEATTRDDLRTKDFLPKDPARQHLCSYWTTLLSGFLGCKIVQEYVREQVSKGRIGIDFRRILESRKPTRRTIR
ncbi:hypothetical protein BGX28_008206 [Mortierella sp. GBA30]|nr:hypothetical protein BGX28_008206 [Mortierella sp. GBA30]